MAKRENIKLEEAIERLENTVSALEGGALSLDEALLKFEEAVGLIKLCSEKIEGAKQKVRILTCDSDGTVSDAPFVGSDEA